MLVNRRTGPFSFGEFRIFVRNIEYVLAMHFCLTWEGWGKESSTFWSDCVGGTTQRGGCGRRYPFRRWGPFGNLGTKNQVLGCVNNLKLTSNRARNVYDCSRRGGGGAGEPFMLLSNVFEN